MKFYAVFRSVVEKHVELDAANWQEAAKIANTMECPIVQAETLLEVVGMCACESSDCECDHYDAVHELVGPCNKCDHQILERGCTETCKGMHAGGNIRSNDGWVSTVHGHVSWCSQSCRDADKINDLDAEVLDRMAGI